MHPVAEQAVIAYDELRGVRWHLWDISVTQLGYREWRYCATTHT
jgi:hypothetical protein